MSVYRMVKGFDKFYRVGTNGSVWTRRIRGSKIINKMGPWKRMKSGPRKGDGYIQVGLALDGIVYFWLLHHLVLRAFVGPCPPGMECRHLDGDPTNNRLDNLAWGTPKQNSEDKIRHGTQSRGLDRWNAKLTPSKVRRIRRLYRTGLFSQTELGRMHKVHQTTIRNVVLKINWRTPTSW